MVSEDPGPVAHIHILQVSEVPLVKISDGLKDLSPVDGPRRTGGKNLSHPVKAPGALPHPSLIGPSQDTVHVPGAVHPVPVRKLYHLAADGKDPFGPADTGGQRSHEPGLRLRIIVEKQHIGSIRLFDACVDRPGKTCIFFQEDRRDPLFLQPFNAAVRGTVVHHQHLKIPVRLPFQRLHAGA